MSNSSNSMILFLNSRNSNFKEYLNLRTRRKRIRNFEWNEFVKSV